MNKKFMVIGIVILFLVVGLSGCNDIKLDDSTQFLISSFDVNPSIINLGETANLSWGVANAQTVSIDNDIGSVANEGKRIIQPSETITFTLTATNETKTLTATTQIIVIRNDDPDESSDITPNLQIVRDNTAKTLTVASASSELDWSDFEITGDCDTSRLVDTVLAGDKITNCLGTISIRHIPTNTLIGMWEFTEHMGDSPQTTPNMQLVRSSTERRLTIASADPGNLRWSEFTIIGDCDISSLGTYVLAGDTITQCYGTITIRHDPTNTLVGSWTFS